MTMTAPTDTAYAPGPCRTSHTIPRAAYRAKVRAELLQAEQELGIVAMIDGFNRMTELCASPTSKIIDADIYAEEVRAYLDTRYPAPSRHPHPYRAAR